MRTSTLQELLGQFNVVIPPIQRDYAQGRDIGKIPHIRQKFIQDIFSVLTDDLKPRLELDFVYGYEEKDKIDQNEIRIFKPLDGQQRITTLYLLHWYIAVQESEIDNAKEMLNRFSYATRKSSRDFCKQLINFVPDNNGDFIDDQIVNQHWFYTAWKNDPTIKSMLVVLREIQSVFKNTNNLWPKLIGGNPRIIFYLLPMDDLGLPDDLYIKMNARGKGLTDFEHFKSRFSEVLTDSHAKIFNEKIDKEWSNLFWNLFKDKNCSDIAIEVDNGFLSFFWYISDILIKRNNLEISSEFWLDRITEIYKDNDVNTSFLFDSINLFEEFELEINNNKQVSEYFNNLFYIQSNDFDVDKTRLFFQNSQINLFKKCCESYGFHDKKGAFSVGEQLFLYAFIYMKLNDSFNSEIFRFLRNIFSSSEDQLRNEYLSSFLYHDIEYIIDNFNEVLNTNTFTDGSKLSKRQCIEEKNKKSAINRHPELKETIHKIEDHSLLRGNIAVLGWDSSLKLFADKFEDVFHSGCDYLEISRAMLTIDDYSQSFYTKRRFGNKSNSTWRELFTQSENRIGFNETKDILKTYLTRLIDFPAISNEQIVEEYFIELNKDLKSPKNFLYYKIKYESFTFWEGNVTKGYFYWEDKDDEPYCCSMLFATMFGGRHWDPFLLQINAINDHCTIENYGNLLQYTNQDLIFKIQTVNNGFKFIETDSNSLDYINSLISLNKLSNDGILFVDQNNEGIDIEDRIEKCNVFLNNLN